MNTKYHRESPVQLSVPYLCGLMTFTFETTFRYSQVTPDKCIRNTNPAETKSTMTLLL
jgi:hypothetical protein